MHFDCYKFTVHINIFDTGCDTEFFQLVKLAGSDRAAEIRKINCRFFHFKPSCNFHMYIKDYPFYTL